MKHFGKMEGERSGKIGKATSILPKESRKSLDLSTGDVLPARVSYSRVQIEWMENPKSDFGIFVGKLKDRMKMTVDGEGKDLPEFELRDWFPSAEKIKLQTGDWNSRFNLTNLWKMVSERLFETVIRSKRAWTVEERFTEQTRLMIIFGQIMSGVNWAGFSILYLNKREKKWFDNRAEEIKRQAFYFEGMGRRTFKREIKARELRTGNIIIPVQSMPDKKVLLRVETECFMLWAVQGVFYIQPQDAFQEDQARYGWEPRFEELTSARNVRRSAKKAAKEATAAEEQKTSEAPSKAEPVVL